MYKGKRISVAIATYNGEKYIEEQIDSILAQTVRPDEIIISDDGSTDHTIDIVRDIARINGDANIEWVILTDNPRHGYTGNFEHALSHSSGDYTFLCDQDDVWTENKVHRVVQAFIDYPDAWLICHNATMADADLKEINALFAPNFPRTQFAPLNGELLLFNREEYLSKSITETLPGMVMCISKECTEKIIPIPKMNGHDTWAFFALFVKSERTFFLRH